MKTSIIFTAAALACGRPDYPMPDVQTPQQKATMANLTARAKTAHENATQKVLALIESDSVQSALKLCCPKVAALTSQELLESIRAEIRAAELAHSFPVDSSSSHFEDVTPAILQKYGWFLNEWQVPLMMNETISTTFNSFAQVNYFGCKPFANESLPTWKEASDRLIYVASNLRRNAFGSMPNFGDVSAIFRNSYIQEMVAIAPMDTGKYYMTCGGGSPPHVLHREASNPASAPGPAPSPYPGPPQPKENCVFSGTVGTLRYFDHVIYENLEVFSTADNMTVAEELVNLVERSAIGRLGYANVPNQTENQMSEYYEANVIGNPRVPEGLKMLIGNYETVFGEGKISNVQKLAENFSLPLMWTYSGGSGGHGGRSEAAAYNDRYLDPTVSSNKQLNMTATAEDREHFWKIFQDVAAARQTSKDGKLGRVFLLKKWNELVSKGQRMAPLGATSCSDAENCVGTDFATGVCVCKKSTENIIV